MIYVADGDCGFQYDPLSPSTPTSAPGCGNAFIRGTYSKDLTIAAESDVVIRGSVTKTNDSVLGPDRQPVRPRSITRSRT